MILPVPIVEFSPVYLERNALLKEILKTSILKHFLGRNMRLKNIEQLLSALTPSTVPVDDILDLIDAFSHNQAAQSLYFILGGFLSIINRANFVHFFRADDKFTTESVQRLQYVAFLKEFKIFLLVDGLLDFADPCWVIFDLVDKLNSFIKLAVKNEIPQILNDLAFKSNPGFSLQGLGGLIEALLDEILGDDSEDFSLVVLVELNVDLHIVRRVFHPAVHFRQAFHL
mmetsp:Transcript_39914/g.45799  ORF Transcript_39914/g.45799 Transcript_39914/m.45799 type:complete len:228 (+) Transcript_39914:1160-1843(+)